MPKKKEEQDMCLAKTKRASKNSPKGAPCQMLKMPGKSRCKYHGGASTGPTTAEGRQRSLAGLAQYRDGKRKIPKLSHAAQKRKDDEETGGGF